MRDHKGEVASEQVVLQMGPRDKTGVARAFMKRELQVDAIPPSIPYEQQQQNKAMLNERNQKIQELKAELEVVKTEN